MWREETVVRRGVESFAGVDGVLRGMVFASGGGPDVKGDVEW